MLSIVQKVELTYGPKSAETNILAPVSQKLIIHKKLVLESLPKRLAGTGYNSDTCITQGCNLKNGSAISTVELISSE